MFDFAWSEIALVAVVALILIGPKDMPIAIRAVTSWVKKARRMAAEFQTHVDEMVRDADLSEVRSSINEIRNFDIKGEIEKTIDADGSIRATFASDPMAATPSAPTSVEEIAAAPMIEALEEKPAPPPEPAGPRAPAFVPPNLVPPAAKADTGAAEAPAFIPPGIAQQRYARPSA